MIIRDNPIRDAAKLVAWYPLRWFVTAAPWAVAYFLGAFVGRVYCLVCRGKIRRIARNIHGALPERLTEEQALRCARTVATRHYVEHMEFYKLATLTRDNVGRHVTMDGIEHVESALASGKGAVLVHMHFGSKQFPLVALGLNGFPVTQVGYRDTAAEDYSFIHRHVHLRLRLRIEARFKAKHVHLGESMRPLYRCLQNNELLMIAGDGVGGARLPGTNYLPLPFLGRTMLFPPGPARLARGTGAPLIPLFCVQEKGSWRYRVVFGPAITLEISDDQKADARENTSRYARLFEEYVRLHPDHWMFWEEFVPGHLLVGEEYPPLPPAQGEGGVGMATPSTT